MKPNLIKDCHFTPKLTYSVVVTFVALKAISKTLRKVKRQ